VSFGHVHLFIQPVSLPKLIYLPLSGGGIKSNEELNNAAPPVLWMGNEAMLAGLELHESRVQWKWNELEKTEPTESLTLWWRFLEILPIKRLSYVSGKTTWYGSFTLRYPF